MTAIVILAGGSSSKMGKPKPLLTWGGKTLVKHLIAVALESAVGPVAVVLGANAELIYPEIENETVHVIHDERYRLGQGTAVQAGARWAMQNQFEGVIYMVCEQPFITAEDVQKIAERSAEYSDLIVGSRYGDNVGLPAYFGSAFYERLVNLPDDQGAKAVFKFAGSQIFEVDLPHAIHNLGTSWDYQRFNPVDLHRSGPDPH